MYHGGTRASSSVSGSEIVLRGVQETLEQEVLLRRLDADVSNHLTNFLRLRPRGEGPITNTRFPSQTPSPFHWVTH